MSDIMGPEGTISRFNGEDWMSLIRNIFSSGESN